MITLTQTEGKQILLGAKQILKDKQLREINNAIMIRYIDIENQIVDQPDPENLVEKDITLNEDLFPGSLMPSEFVCRFMIDYPAMRKLFDLKK